MDQEALIEAYKATEKALLENQRTDLLYGVREGAPPIAPWPAEPCKLVFLDFDGVLNCDLSVCQLGTRYKFWPPSIKALNELLAESGARIVISSTWREHWTLSENAASLERAGLLPGRVVGKTSVSNGERGMETDSWLKSVRIQLGLLSFWTTKRTWLCTIGAWCGWTRQGWAGCKRSAAGACFA